MLGFDKKKVTPASAGSVETLIGARVDIRGDLKFSGGLYVEGTIHGAVIAEDGASDAVLTVAEKGSIHGEVRAPHVIVNGHLTGDVFASERIELGSNARVQGNIHYKLVEMAGGAMVTGRMIHGEVPVQRQLPKPESTKDRPEGGKPDKHEAAKERRDAAA